MSADVDRRVRHAVYRSFVTTGVPPTTATLATEARITESKVVAALKRLAAAHDLVLAPDSEQIAMAHPFSSRPVGYAVSIGDRSFQANCAWDGLGILALLGDGVVSTAAPLTVEPWLYRVNRGRVAPNGLVSFPVEARSFWDDIGFT